VIHGAQLPAIAAKILAALNFLCWIYRVRTTMSGYQRHLLSLMAFWAVFAATVVVAWRMPSRSVWLSGLVGTVIGMAAGLTDSQQLPIRLVSSTISTKFHEDIGAMWGRLLLLWILTAASPFFARNSPPPEVLWIILLTFAAVCFGYLTAALGRAFVQERRLGVILQKTMFPGSLGLPEELRGQLVLIRDADGPVGTIDIGDLLLEVRSVTDEPLVAGQLAKLIAVEDTALLVLQDFTFEEEEDSILL
jgi:uncharacterized membrane protein